MATLGEILKRRIGKGEGQVSKAAVAAELGVSEKTVENYMNDNRSPKPDALVRLSRLLNFELSELSEGISNEQNVPRETRGKGAGMPAAGQRDPRDQEIIELYKSQVSDLRDRLREKEDIIAKMETSFAELRQNQLMIAALVRTALGGVADIRAAQQKAKPESVRSKQNIEIAAHYGTYQKTGNLLDGSTPGR